MPQANGAVQPADGTTAEQHASLPVEQQRRLRRLRALQLVPAEEEAEEQVLVAVRQPGAHPHSHPAPRPARILYT